MTTSRITELRLTRFKGFREETFNVLPFSMLIGPNGSGKSNTLDALSLLALLASDRTLSDLDRDDPEVAGLRGGLSGCSPFGVEKIKIGVSVDIDTVTTASLDVELDPTTSEIASERLTLQQRDRSDITLIDAERESVGSGLLNAKVYSGRYPKNFTMPANRLTTFQCISRVPTDTKSRQLVVSTAQHVIQTLAGILVLDPVPSRMRTYTRIGADPDRTASTLSAQLYELRDDSESWESVVSMVRALINAPNTDITFSVGKLEHVNNPTDVMAALRSVGPDGEFVTPASTMSDGTLRYLAILTSLQTLNRPQNHGEFESSRTIVIEEVENGLFPEQASDLLSTLKTQAARHDITLILTTHSPALLNATTPEDHEGITTVSRDETSLSHLTSLPDHPNYLDLVERGKLGSEISSGALTDSSVPTRTMTKIGDLLS